MSGLDEKTDESITDDAKADELSSRGRGGSRGIASRLLSGILLALPLLAVVVSLAYSCAVCYSEGIDFDKGYHGFTVLLHAILVAVAFLVALAVSCLWIVSRWRKLSLKIKLLEVGAAMLPIVLVLYSMSLMWTFHRLGRDKGYASIDYERLRSECIALLALYDPEADNRCILFDLEQIDLYDSEEAKDRYILCDLEQDGSDGLPDYFIRLNPSFIALSKECIVLQMDGGDIRPHTGVVVLLGAPEQNSIWSQCQNGTVTVLDAKSGVYRYYLNEWSDLPAY